MEKLYGKKINTAVFISGRGSNLKSLIKHNKKKNSPFSIKLIISGSTLDSPIHLALAKAFLIYLCIVRNDNIDKLLFLLKVFPSNLFLLFCNPFHNENHDHSFDNYSSSYSSKISSFSSVKYSPQKGQCSILYSLFSMLCDILNSASHDSQYITFLIEFHNHQQHKQVLVNW